MLTATLLCGNTMEGETMKPTGKTRWLTEPNRCDDCGQIHQGGCPWER